MSKKKLNAFQVFLTLCSNQSGNIRLGFNRPRFMDEGGEGGDGGGGGGNGEGGDGKPDKDGKYPKEFVEKLLREKNNFKTKATELETKIKDLEAKDGNPAPKPDPANDPNKGGDNELKEMLKQEQIKRQELETKLQNEEKAKKEAMKLGALKREFEKNGGDIKAFDLVKKVAEVEKIFIDEDSQVVYGAETEVKRLKELAPQFFGKTTKKTEQNDFNNHVSVELDESIFKGKRISGKDKSTTHDALIDFYSASGIVTKK